MKKCSFFLLSITILFSCSIKKKDQKIFLASEQAKKYYKYYSADDYEPILNMFYDADTNSVHIHLNDMTKKYGKIINSEVIEVNDVSRFTNRKTELEVNVIYKVTYESGITKETFKFLFNDTDSNKIYSMRVVKWEDEK